MPANPLDEVGAAPNVDDVFTKSPRQLAPDAFRRLIAHFRIKRAQWEMKKGDDA